MIWTLHTQLECQRHTNTNYINGLQVNEYLTSDPTLTYTKMWFTSKEYIPFCFHYVTQAWWKLFPFFCNVIISWKQVIFFSFFQPIVCFFSWSLIQENHFFLNKKWYLEAPIYLTLIFFYFVLFFWLLQRILKGATKSYFMYYSLVVIILFSTGL